MTLMPAWAVTVLGGDARTNGWLQAARGFGALLGALMVVVIGAKDVFYALHEWVFPSDHQWFFFYQDSLMSTMMKAPDFFGYVAAALVSLALIILCLILSAASRYTCSISR